MHEEPLCSLQCAENLERTLAHERELEASRTESYMWKRNLSLTVGILIAIVFESDIPTGLLGHTTSVSTIMLLALAAGGRAADALSTIVALRARLEESAPGLGGAPSSIRLLMLALVQAVCLAVWYLLLGDSDYARVPFVVVATISNFATLQNLLLVLLSNQIARSARYSLFPSEDVRLTQKLVAVLAIAPAIACVSAAARGGDVLTASLVCVGAMFVAAILTT
jgi:hypothetical protein